MQFDHIGMTASDLAAGRALLEGALDVTAWTQEFCDEVNDVWVQFGHCPAGVCYELVAPLSETSPIGRVLAKRINVLNHLAYLVDDLAVSGTKLAAMEFVSVAAPKPAIAYGGRSIQFFVAPTRLIIELIEAPGHRHVFDFPPSPRIP